MRKFLLSSAVVLGLAGLASTAQAQSMPNGDELYGQTVDVVFPDGNRNAIFFDRSGRAIITSQSGQRVDGSWNVTDNRICLVANGGRECWNYARRFVAGQTVVLTSTCQSNSQWTARNVNIRVVDPVGERG